MDFTFTPQEQAFRQEVRDFLAAELPPDWEGPEMFEAEESPVARHLRRRLGERGYLTIGWPREYGGMGASYVSQAIFFEEMAYHRAPGLDSNAIRMLGPTLMLHGTEEQKRQFLPPIARGEVRWCQGYSEPGAGSDLASLQTRAVADGDDYVINGSKIWTSNAHAADWIFLLARTNPDALKHKGISFLLVDMHAPGVSVRPIVNMAGAHYFNQVFFDNVRTPRQYRVGEEGQGWYVAMSLLDFERSSIERSALARRALDDLRRFILDAPLGASLARRNPQVQYRLADRYIEAQVARLLAYRVAWMQGQGQVPNQEASMSKLFGTETLQRVAHTALDLLGPYGPLRTGSRRAQLNGRFARFYLLAYAQTIGAGTSEVQRNIIATRGLGLPRA